MNFHTPKWTPIVRIGVLNGLPNLQSAIVGVKTHWFKEILYHWKDIETYMFKMSSHDPFVYLKHKLWSKERLGVKLVVWLSSTKSRELTRFPNVQEMCDILLENSRRGIQLCFRPHYNRRCARQGMGPQSCKSPNCANFGSPGTQSHLDVAPMESCREYYKGCCFPRVRAVMSFVSPRLLVARLSTKSVQTMH
jgi:hypothetical protein